MRVCSLAQPCPTLCDPIDFSPPGISQASMLAWVPISSCLGSLQHRDWSCTFYGSCTGRRILYCWATWQAHRHKYTYIDKLTDSMLGFPGGSVVNNVAASGGDAGSISGSGISPGEGNDNPLQYCCLGNLKDRVAWLTTVHGMARSGTPALWLNKNK